MQSFFFFPDRVKYGSPADHGLGFENVYFYSADKTRLNGWFIAAESKSEVEIKGTVIHMHGNAQNMTAHWMFASWLPSQGYNVFAFDYRGYGQSEGQPDEQGLFEDSVAAIEYIANREDIAPDKIVVFGQSLGGMLSIAASTVCKQHVKAVVAEAPALSYEEWAFDMMPELQLPTDDTYTAESYVEQLSPVPLMLLHGTKDKVVPFSHSEQIFALAGEPKQFVAIDNGSHNDAMTSKHGDKYQKVMLDFFDQYLV